MDPSAVNVNVTVDDFDSVLSYADQSVWTTPDPSSSSFDNNGSSPWFMGTYHRTESIGASLSFNFTGPAIYIYGHAGPDYGSYEVDIDDVATVLSAHLETNATTPYLLYGASNLTYAQHTLALRNLGAKSNASGNAFLFDFLQATIQVAPAGATVSNVTYEEDNPALTYTGQWGNNTGPVFSGGGTTFTNATNASVSLSFHGSAIYIFGDKKNDHGFYNVTLDNKTSAIFNGVSGCGGAFGATCEQQKPTLQYIAHNLDGSLHTVKVENLAGVNNSFLDIDSFVVTVPSVYAVRNLSETASGAMPSPVPSATGTNSANTDMVNYWNLLLVSFLIHWVIRRNLHH